ncbi:MAG: LysR family transcriptional regulator [Rubrivivax sp.]|nr:LysR family transcriptional regulator [Rubrivivax sp.]
MDTAIDLRHLRHVVMLAEELNFGRAAGRAHLSQTAFSRSIQVAEDRFGLRLFDRHTRSVRLTPAGVQLIAQARQLLAQAAELSRQVDDLAHAEGGRLAIGATLLAVDDVLLKVLPDFRRLRPRLELAVEVGHWQHMAQLLEQERIELYVGYPGPAASRPGFEVRRLPPRPASIFCRADHPLAQGGAALAGRRLAGFPWATVQMADEIGAKLRSLLKLPQQATLPLSLSCDNQSLLRQALLTSDVLLLTWRSWLKAELDEGAVVDLGLRLRLPASAMGIECAIVRLAGRSLSPAATRLVDLVVNAPAA